MSITKAYQDAVSAHGYVQDAAQLRVVQKLAALQLQLRQDESFGARIRRMLPGRSSKSGTAGIYLWGGVGRGKTFLMDLFFESLDVQKKRRIHFHRMMREIHGRMRSLDDVENPLQTVATDIAADTRVLCFDEFFVSDIGDAMILGQLLDGLFRAGVTLVATSNSRPDELYKDGLQRDRFLPAIELLERHTEVIELDGLADYRLRLLQEAGTYLTPLNSETDQQLCRYFDEIASGQTRTAQPLQVLGRELKTLFCAKGVVWFDFNDICVGPRSQEDYIEIARWYPTVIVSGVPPLGRKLENPARRFIALVDEFYERKVKLVISAAIAIDMLYAGEQLKFEFQRTTSRLIEMQSQEYLHAPHLA